MPAWALLSLSRIRRWRQGQRFFAWLEYRVRELLVGGVGAARVDVALRGRGDCPLRTHVWENTHVALFVHYDASQLLFMFVPHAN